MTSIPPSTLAAIEARFHDLIRRIAAPAPNIDKLALPRLAPLLTTPLSDEQSWFPVPGMFGGFAYHFEGEGRHAKLVVASWCRIVEGSGQQHEITQDGVRLVDEGFV